MTRKRQTPSVVSTGDDRDDAVAYITDQGERPEQLDRISQFKLDCTTMNFDQLKNLIEDALKSLAENCNKISGSGTTLTFTLYFDKHVLVYSIGDSIGYWIESSWKAKDCVVSISEIAGVHTFFNRDEDNRLEKCKAVVLTDNAGEKRIGGLNMTGSLGDADITGLSREYYLFDRKITDTSQKIIVITASDGMALNRDIVGKQFKRCSRTKRSLLEALVNNESRLGDNASLFIQHVSRFQFPDNQAYCTYIADGHRSAVVVDYVGNHLEKEIRHRIGERQKQHHLNHFEMKLSQNSSEINLDLSSSIRKIYEQSVELIPPTYFNYQACEHRASTIVQFMVELSRVRKLTLAISQAINSDQIPSLLAECDELADSFYPHPIVADKSKKNMIVKHIREYPPVAEALEAYFKYSVHNILQCYLETYCHFKQDIHLKNAIFKATFKHTLQSLYPDLVEMFLERRGCDSTLIKLKKLTDLISSVDTLTSHSNISIEFVYELIRFQKNAYKKNWIEYSFVNRIIQCCETWLFTNIDSFDDIAKLKPFLNSKRLNNILDSEDFMDMFRRHIYRRILYLGHSMTKNLALCCQYPERFTDQSELDNIIMAAHNQMSDIFRSQADVHIRPRVFNFYNQLKHYQRIFNEFYTIIQNHEDAAQVIDHDGVLSQVFDQTDLYHLCKIIQGHGENPVLYKPIRTIMLNALRYSLDKSIHVYCESLSLAEQKKWKIEEAKKRYFMAVQNNNLTNQQLGDFIELCIKLPYLFRPLYHTEIPRSHKASIIYNNCYKSPFYFSKANKPLVILYSYKNMALIFGAIFITTLIVQALFVKWFMMMNIIANSHGFLAGFMSITMASYIPILPVLAGLLAVLGALYFGVTRLASEQHCEYNLILKLISTSAHHAAHSNDVNIPTENSLRFI